MSRRIVLLLVSVLLAACGTAALYSYVGRAGADAASGYQDTVPVLVAAATLRSGATAQEVAAASRVQQYPRALSPDGALPAAGRIPADTVLVSDLARGQPIVGSAFGARASNGIPAGHVQVAVDVDHPDRVADLVRPGDDVAVYVTGTAGREGPLTEVLAKARVHSVLPAKGVAVFMVPQADGVQLAQAAKTGEVVLLRLPGAQSTAPSGAG